MTGYDRRIEAEKTASRLDAASYIGQGRRWPRKAERRRGRRRQRFAYRGDVSREVSGSQSLFVTRRYLAGLGISVTGHRASGRVRGGRHA